MKYPGKYGTPWRQLRALTLEEKASLFEWARFLAHKGHPEKGVKSLFMADGPHGVRKEDKLHTRRNGGASVPATCFSLRRHTGVLVQPVPGAMRGAGPWAKKPRPRAWAFCWGRG